MTKEQETITISLELYIKLLKDSEWLSYLEQAGVDNWEGLSFAHDLASEKGFDYDD